MNKFRKKLGETLSGEGFFSTAGLVALIAATVALNILLYVIVSAFGIYLYQEEKPNLEISGNTDSLFEPAIESGKVAKIIFCMAKEEVENHDTGRYVHETALNFKERYPNLIEISYLNLVTMQNEKMEYVNVDKYTNDGQTKLRRHSVIFECGENYRVITDTYTSAGFAPFFVVNSEKIALAYNGEETIASMISWVLTDERKTVYFTQYHGEIVDIQFSNFLASAGYYVDVIDLRRDEVPLDADLLIISSPTSDFEKGSGVRAEMDRLKTYVERGGNIYVSLDPYVKKQMPTLYSFLAEWGIKFSTSEDKDGKPVNNMVKDYNNGITANGTTLVTEYAKNELAQKIENKVKKYTDGSVIVKTSAALSLFDGAKPLLLSSSGSVLEADGETKSRNGSYCVAAYSEKTVEDKTARIFVVPSIYLAVTDSLISNGYSNKDFLYSLIEDFYGGGRMPYGCKPVIYDSQTLENLTMGTAKVYTAAILALPVAILICGAVVLVKRKNR